MKKILLIILSLTLLLSGCGKKPGEGLILLHKGSANIEFLKDVWREETQIDLPNDVEIEVLFDDFSAEEYAGSSLCIANFEKSEYSDSMISQIELQENWKKSPIDEKCKQYLTEAVQKAGIALPDFENGYYMGKFVCWIDNEEKIIYSPDEPTDIEIITVSYWDETAKIMYYYCLVPQIS